MRIVFTTALLMVFGFVSAQGLIHQAESELNPDQPLLRCGSHDFMKQIDNKTGNFMELSNQMMRSVQQTKMFKGTLGADDVITIPVVFHVVYHHDLENLPDSVIQNQLKALNNCFRRRNADTVNMRSDFEGLVGDAKIQFVLASKDPGGQPTSGIVRKSTTIDDFGGTLPYKQGQNTEIIKWVNDSFYNNLFRITRDENGGSTIWDPNTYLNIWIGDLRVYEPQVNDVHEILFMGLTTPPIGHPNWPAEVVKVFKNFDQGVLIHYNSIGPNNPALFEAPYTQFNGVANTGKIVVHEVGHYFGLRHIWGDGDCSADDYVDDTPRAGAASNWGCSQLNSCKDTINGKDLPNMIENYMDYSGSSCMNSFTKGQIDVMRFVINNYRAPLLSVNKLEQAAIARIYPNPSSGLITIDFISNSLNHIIKIYDLSGQEITTKTVFNSKSIQMETSFTPGLYWVEIVGDNGWVQREKLVVQ